MQNRAMNPLAALGVLCLGLTAFCELAPAQRPIQNPITGKPREYFEPAPYDPFYDARDFSGIWFRVGGARGHGPENTHPALTEEGIERMKTHHPTRTIPSVSR